MEKVRLALIGCGPRGLRGHGKGLSTSDKIELISVCDLDETMARDGAKQLETEYCTDHIELLERDDLDGIVIVTATKFHEPIAMDAAERGKHVLVEKPMADDIGKAKQLVAAMKDKSLVGMVGYQNRYHPFYSALKEAADQIDPVQILDSRQRALMKDKYMNPDRFCGIMDFVSHDFDLMAWLMGRKPTSVFATIQRNTWTDTGAMEVIDAHIEFGGDDNRRTAVINSSLGGEQLGRMCNIVGKKGYAGGAGMATVKAVIDGEDRTIDTTGAKQDATAVMLERFADAIRGQAEPSASFEDGLDSLLMSEAAIESSDTGQKIDLEEFQSRFG